MKRFHITPHPIITGRKPQSSGQTLGSRGDVKKDLTGNEDGFGQRGWQHLVASHHLSHALMNQAKWREAEVILEEVVKGRTRTNGKKHPSTLINLYHLSRCLYHQGNWSEAERIQREVLRIDEKVRGKDHPYTINTRNALMSTIRSIQLTSNPSNVSDELSKSQILIRYSIDSRRPRCTFTPKTWSKYRLLDRRYRK